MTAPAKHARRQRRGDRLITPGASQQEVAVDHAVAPFDRLSLEMERKWGVDKLVEKVSPQTAAKFGSAMAKLNAAITADDPDEVAARAAVCIRGLQAMDREATEAGFQPVPDGYWIYNHDGEEMIFAQDNRDWRAIEARHPGVRIWSCREIALALQHYGESVVAAKDAFPAAKVVSIRRTDWKKELEDEIPW
jgi:hypothetical protein